MKTYNNFLFSILAAALVLSACKKDDDTKPDDNADIDVSHSFTLSENNTFKYFVDGNEIGGTLRVLNSLNNHLYLSVDLMDNSLINTMGGVILPKSKGEFMSGYDFGAGNGTNGNNVFLNAFLKIDGETYYAYSSHAYGFLESELVEGSECKLKINKFSGDYVTYSWWNMTLTGFVGEAEVLFAGTFKTKDGTKTRKIEKGEIKIHGELPEGAEIIE